MIYAIIGGCNRTFFIQSGQQIRKEAEDMNMITLKDIQKSYGTHQVLKDVNLNIHQGEIYGLIGKNGAGKTTIFKIILGLSEFEHGKISIAGSKSNNDLLRARKRIGFFIGKNFFDYLDARDNLDYYCMMKGIKDKKEIDRVLEFVGLQNAKGQFGGFSMGMKQRLGIAGAMLGNPEIIILDEPVNGLDPQGIGSSGYLERFTVDYDLPNEYNYSENCASIRLALFGLRMAQITGESQYMDVAERALYNTVLAGIVLDGKSFFYVNPLEVWPPACMEGTSKKHVKPIRQKWFGVACCPPNIARTLASLGQYVYAQKPEKKELYVNLFVSNETELDWNEDKISVKLQTEFPWVNTYSLEVKNVPVDGMDLMLRVPDYAQDYQVKADGKLCKENKEPEKGYRRVHIEKDTKIEVSFAAPAKFVYANPQVRADSGKAAIVRGPLVYCLEEIDNSQNLPAIFVDTDAPLREEKSDLFGGIVTVKVKAKKIVESSVSDSLYSGQKPQLEDIELTAIPYPYWNNRGEGEMLVWMKELRP